MGMGMGMGMGSIWDRRMGMVILVVSEVIQKAEGDPKNAQDDLRNSLGRPVGVVVRLVMSGWQGECPETTLHGPMTEGARGPVRPQGEGCGCSDWRCVVGAGGGAASQDGRTVGRVTQRSLSPHWSLRVLGNCGF